MTLPSLPRTTLAGMLWLAGSIATGCGPIAGGSTVTPGGRIPGTREGPAPVGTQEGDSVPELEKRLERLSGEQAARMDDAMTDTQACHDLCSLSSSICEVEVKLCDIADRHPQESGFQELCREAQQECRQAELSCADCVGEHTDNNMTPQPPADPPVAAPTPTEPATAS
ncbi:MAG: hypothetical protein ACRBN8_35030 [Nannocystales bacterium]